MSPGEKVAALLFSAEHRMYNYSYVHPKMNIYYLLALITHMTFVFFLLSTKEKTYQTVSSYMTRLTCFKTTAPDVNIFHKYEPQKQ